MVSTHRMLELLNMDLCESMHVQKWCYVHNNGKDALEKFDAKSDKEIFLGYAS